MATFYALTTTNPSGGYHILGSADSRTEAETLVSEIEGSDIYAETKRINFIVLSKTQAAKRFGQRGLDSMIEFWCNEDFSALVECQ